MATAVNASEKPVVNHPEIPFGPTEDADKSTKERHERNLKLIAEKKAKAESIKVKYNDPDTGKSHVASATVVQYETMDALIQAWGEKDALKLANQGSELRQRSSISAVLRAKAQGPEKAAALGLKSLAKAGFNANDLLLALQALDPEKAEMLKSLMGNKDEDNKEDA